MLWRKRKPKKPSYRAKEILALIDDVANKLDLRENETLDGSMPIYIGIRDFDPTHSYSCASVRGKVTKWALGAFIDTSFRLIFKKLNEDGTFSTVLNIPHVNIYEVEVGGAEDKHLEMCTSAGSFEFRVFANDTIYDLAEIMQTKCDLARQKRRETLHPIVSVIACKYCEVRNKPDATFCVNCGAVLK